MLGALGLPNDDAASAQLPIEDRLRQVGAQLAAADVFDLVEGELRLQLPLEIDLQRFALQLDRTLPELALHISHFCLRFGRGAFPALFFNRVLFTLKGVALLRFRFRIRADERLLLGVFGLRLLQLRLQILSALRGFGEPRLSNRFRLPPNIRFALLTLGLLFDELPLQLLLRRPLLLELHLQRFLPLRAICQLLLVLRLRLGADSFFALGPRRFRFDAHVMHRIGDGRLLFLFVVGAEGLAELEAVPASGAFQLADADSHGRFLCASVGFGWEICIAGSSLTIRQFRQFVDDAHRLHADGDDFLQQIDDIARIRRCIRWGRGQYRCFVR